MTTSVRLRAALVSALVAVLLLAVKVRPSEAQLGLACSVSTTSVAFGNYDVFGTSAVDSAGSIQVQCVAGLLLRVQLTSGGSGDFAARTLQNGAERLSYNLYLDPSRRTIFGDGSGTTSTYSQVLQALVPVTIPVYGRVLAQQDVRAGAYSDTVVTTLVF